MVYTYVHHRPHIFLIIFITHYYNGYVSLICNFIKMVSHLVIVAISSDRCDGDINICGIIAHITTSIRCVV